jgi:4-carboxymuconolactone decarboxylase
MLQPGFYITAELRVKDERKVEEAKSALTALCQETEREPGCSLFTLHQCSEEKGRFLLWERFDDEAAFKQHFEEPHTKDYLAKDLTEIIQVFKSNLVL